MLSTINNNHTAKNGGVSDGNPVGVNDQFLNWFTYFANLNLSIKKWVINITLNAAGEAINTKGSEYKVQCIRQANQPSFVNSTFLLAIQWFWVM